MNLTNAPSFGEYINEGKINKVKPFNVDGQWWKFRDKKDGKDYHNFSYTGYYLDNKEIYDFSCNYPDGEDGEKEKAAATAFLIRNKIPFNNDPSFGNRIGFPGTYVDLTGNADYKGNEFTNDVNYAKNGFKYTLKGK